MAKRQKTKRPRSKAPSFTLECDDLVLVDDEGNEYYPHVGESVKMRNEIPWELARVANGGTNYDYYALAIRILKRQILDWDWTDDNEKLMPKPGTDDFELCLWQMDDQERDWLLAHCWKPAEIPNG